MNELARGKVSASLVDEYPKPIERERIRLRPARTNRILGITISPTEQIERLRSIELEVEESGDALVVTPPGFRPDLAREVDLVEEVARLHGFQELPSTLPPGAAGGLDRAQAAERRVRVTLADLGLYEAWTPSLVPPHDLDLIGLDADHPARRTVAPSNPMSEDESVLRTTLLPSLVRAIARNQARHIQDVALFEVARVYEQSDEVLPQEGLVLAAAMSGNRTPQTWNAAARRWDFFEAKAIITALGRALRLPDLFYGTVNGMPFHPTRAASIALGETPVGVLGELHPDVCERFDVAEGTVTFELSLAPLFAALPERVQVEQPSKLPSTYIDLAVVVEESVTAAAVREVIEQTGAPEVTSVRLFDLYRGEQLEAGKKSLAFALELKHPDRTMTDEEAAAVRDRIVPALQERTGGTLRT
jgi:phenylalanyl-tRNA synthetase beta chain